MPNSWEIADQATTMLREVHQARADVVNLLAELARQRDQMVGAALWCSLTDHAFSSQDRKRTTFTIGTFDDDGQPVSETLMACGPCGAKRRGVLEAKPAIPSKADAELYAQYLEWRNGMAPEPAKPEGM